MKVRCRKLLNYMLVSLLSLLGFSCEGGLVDDDNQMLMYGTPMATYKVGITANDATTGKPVEGLRVRLYTGHPNSMYKVDSALVDANGVCNLVTSAVTCSKLKVTITDIDGSEKGSYQDFSQEFTITPDDYQGGKGWDAGSVTKKVSAKVNPK